MIQRGSNPSGNCKRYVHSQCPGKLTRGGATGQQYCTCRCHDRAVTFRRRERMKPRIRRQTIGWAVEQGLYLIGVETTFAQACALAGGWVRDDLRVV